MFPSECLHLMYNISWGVLCSGILCCNRGAEAVTRTNLNYTYQLSATALFCLRT